MSHECHTWRIRLPAIRLFVQHLVQQQRKHHALHWCNSARWSWWIPANPMVSSSNGNIFRDIVQNSPVTGEFPSQGQWRGGLMFSLIYAGSIGWVNNRDARGLKGHRAHYDVTVMGKYFHIMKSSWVADYGSNICCQQRNALSGLLDQLRYRWRGLLGMRCVGGYNIIDIWA